MQAIVRGLVISALLAPTASLPAGEDDRAAFLAAYAEYQALLEADDAERLAAAAGKAYELGLAILPADDRSLPALAVNYGSALIDAGDDDAAVAVLTEAIDHYEEAYGADAVELVPVYMALGNTTGEVFDADRQRRYYRRALKLAASHYGPRSAEYGYYSLQAGIGLMNESQSADARRFLEEGHEILLETQGAEDPTTGIAAFHLGRYHVARRNYRKAEGFLVAALQTFEDPERPTSKLEVGAHAWLVSIYQELGVPQQATPHCQAIGRMTPFSENQDYQPLFRRAPRYPAGALQRGRQGFADVRFTVDDQGFVRDAEIIAYEGDAAFKAAALDAVADFRYAPRFVNGEPVATAGIETRISFTIND